MDDTTQKYVTVFVFVTVLGLSRGRCSNYYIDLHIISIDENCWLIWFFCHEGPVVWRYNLFMCHDEDENETENVFVPSI